MIPSRGPRGHPLEGMLEAKPNKVIGAVTLLNR